MGAIEKGLFEKLGVKIEAKEPVTEADFAGTGLIERASQVSFILSPTVRKVITRANLALHTHPVFSSFDYSRLLMVLSTNAVADEYPGIAITHEEIETADSDIQIVRMLVNREFPPDAEVGLDKCLEVVSPLFEEARKQDVLLIDPPDHPLQ